MRKLPVYIAIFSLVANNVFAFGVKHNFSVSIGPFNTCSAELDYNISNKEYNATSTVATHGVFETFYPFTAKYVSKGKIIKSELQVQDYFYNSKSRFNQHFKQLIYDKNGNPTEYIKIKNGKEKHSKIKLEDKNLDTLDFQSAFTEFALHFKQFRFCDSTHRAFDGKRRFDIIFQDEGREMLVADENSSFSGIATKCSMYIDNLNAKSNHLLWKISKQRPVYFWIGESPKSKTPFIIKATFKDTPLGDVEIFAKDLEFKE